MLIRKINSVFMKHSRWLFGIFTVVIIVSFLGFLTPGQFGVGGCSDPGLARVGSAFGKPVTYNELREQIQSQAVFARIAYGVSMNDISPEAAFGQVCIRRAAELRGIAVTDVEVANEIKGLPTFAVNGKFDYTRYEEQIAALRKQGIDSEMLVNACRNWLFSQKLRQELMASVVITPGEVEQFYLQANENYQAKVADFKYETFVKEVKVKPAELKTYFDANRANYKIPTQLDAEIVTFSFTSPEALKLGGAVTEEDAKAWYEKNSSNFIKDGKIRPYSEVKADVKARCSAERVRAAVTREAQKFATEAYGILDESADKKAAFAKLAAERKLKTVKTGKFAATAAAAGTIAEPALIKELGAVYTVPITNAVPGREAAYVGFLVERVDERNAEFNEVSRQVQDDFIRTAAIKLAREAAEAEAKTLAALKPEQRLAAKVWSKTLSFSLMKPSAEMEGQWVAMAAAPLAVGEISKVLPTPEGAMLVAVVKRTPADLKEFEAQKMQWETMWRQSKMRSVMADFDNYLQSQCIFEMEGNQR